MIPEELQQNPVVAAVSQRFPGAVLEASSDLGELSIVVDPAKIVDICRSLKKDEKFIRLSSVTAVDWIPREPRFDVVYHMQSFERKLWLRVKARVSGNQPEIDSVFPVWKGSDWYEREVFDLFGIVFRGHPNMKRIMLPDDWQGHPLRKDFPVHGYKYSYAEEQ